MTHIVECALAAVLLGAAMLGFIDESAPIPPVRFDSSIDQMAPEFWRVQPIEFEI